MDKCTKHMIRLPVSSSCIKIFCLTLIYILICILECFIFVVSVQLVVQLKDVFQKKWLL